MIKKISIIFAILWLCNDVEAQVLLVPVNETELDSVMDNLITEDYYVDTNKELKIVFTFKIDSTGQIHSAHIRWYRNLKLEDSYSICYEIETNLCVKFVYEKFKDYFIGEQYVYSDYLYRSNR